MLRYFSLTDTLNTKDVQVNFNSLPLALSSLYLQCVLIALIPAYVQSFKIPTEFCEFHLLLYYSLVVP